MSLKIYFGLGNVGSRYDNTRHNAGFYFLDIFAKFLALSKIYSVSEFRLEEKFSAYVAEVRRIVEFGGQTVAVLVKPTTFMNLSGISAKKIVDFFKTTPPNNFVLVHDDLDIPLGVCKIQKNKSPKSHNGVNSVEQTLKNKEFLRIRIGVDSRTEEERFRISPADYVLMKMKTEELTSLEDACKRATVEIMKRGI